MPIINAATLDGAFESLKGLFDATLQSAKDDFGFTLDPFMDTMTGTGKSVTVNWFGDIPALRKWVGDRQVRNLRGKAYTITNVPWEDTVGVDVIDINTDQFGLIRPQVQRMAREVLRFKLRRFAVALEANGLCADGQNLMDDDHPKDDGTTWDNKGTAALTYDNLMTALKVGPAITDMNGDPAGISYDTLMVPVALMEEAYQYTQAVGKPGTANNDINIVNRLGLKPVINPFLTDANNWYLLDSKAPVKPFLYTEAAGSNLGALAEDRSQEFAKGQILYGVDGWAEVSPYFPYGLYGSIV